MVHESNKNKSGNHESHIKQIQRQDKYESRSQYHPQMNKNSRCNLETNQLINPRKKKKKTQNKR